MGIMAKTNKRKSTSYIGTFEIGCASDMLELEELKVMVRNMNGMLKESGYDYKYRVCLRGRKPITSYNRCGNVIGGISNASKLDAYIYQDRR